MRRLCLFCVGLFLGALLFFAAQSVPGPVQTRDYPDCYLFGPAVPATTLSSYGCHR